MEEAEGIRDRFHHVAGLRFHIGVKERFADDGECQRGDLLMRCGKNRIKSSWGRGMRMRCRRDIHERREGAVAQ